MYKHVYMLAVISLLVACVEPASNDKPLDLLNGSHVSDDVIYSVISSTQEMARDYINTDNYTLTVHGTVEDSKEACGNSGEVGCHNKGLHYIHTPWPSEHDEWDAATLNAVSAYTICHELGHLYYYDTTGDSDADHLHTEWFDGNKVDSVCGLVYDQYKKSVLK